MAVLFTSAPSGARLPRRKVMVLARPRSRARVGDMITSSGSMPSSACSFSRSRRRRSEASHHSRFSPSVRPDTVRASRRSRPASRRCSMISGTPPARNTCTVAKCFGPLGSTSTRRGTERLMRVQSSTVGRRKPMACAIAGTCSTRFVEPPKAACVTIALCTASSVSTSRVVRPWASRAISARADRRARSRQISAPEGLRAPCGSARPSASATTCARGGGAHELAAAAGRAAGAASHVRGVLQRDFLARETGRERLHLAGVLGFLRQQRDPARHEDRRQIGHARQRHQHRGQALVAGGDAQHAAPRGQRTDQSPQHDRGVVAVRQAIEHAGGAVGAAVAWIAAVRRERNRAAPLRTSARPPPSAGRLPNVRCDSRARSACRQARESRLAC